MPFIKVDKDVFSPFCSSKNRGKPWSPHFSPEDMNPSHKADHTVKKPLCRKAPQFFGPSVKRLPVILPLCKKALSNLVPS